MKLVTSLAVSAAVFLAPVSASGQVDPLQRAVATFHRQMVELLEEALFQHTKRTSTVIYARKLTGKFSSARYCGEALVGSSRQRFIIDLSEGMVVTAPSGSVWERSSCNEQFKDTITLIDLR